jgi:hypothetical protein
MRSNVTSQIILIRLITPLSYVYLLLLANWAFLWPTREFNYNYFGGKVCFFLLTAWMTCEALFFPYYYFLFTRVDQTAQSGEVTYSIVSYYSIVCIPSHTIRPALHTYSITLHTASIAALC